MINMVLSHAFEYLRDVREWQAVQTAPDRVLVRLEPLPGATSTRAWRGPPSTGSSPCTTSRTSGSTSRSSPGSPRPGDREIPSHDQPGRPAAPEPTHAGVEDGLELDPVSEAWTASVAALVTDFAKGRCGSGVDRTCRPMRGSVPPPADAARPSSRRGGPASRPARSSASRLTRPGTSLGEWNVSEEPDHVAQHAHGGQPPRGERLVVHPRPEHAEPGPGQAQRLGGTPRRAGAPGPRPQR